MAFQQFKLNQDDGKEIINKVISCLQHDGLVIAPSDTVYGVLVNAKSATAVKKLLAFKDRPVGKPISVFVSGFEMLHQYAVVPESKKGLISSLLPGPYTVVLDSLHKIDTLLESEKGTLGLRYIDVPFVTELVAAFGSPVTATSANLSSTSPHYSVESLLQSLPAGKKELIDLIVDGGKLPIRKPSTVIDLSSSDIQVLRSGDIIPIRSETRRSSSEKETRAIGAALIQELMKQAQGKRIVVILKGELGAGKTQFVKGVAGQFALTNVVSPTFVIYYEYDIPGSEIYQRFYHFDLYNIQRNEEFEQLGLEEIAAQQAIVCVEWGERMGNAYDQFMKDAQTAMVEIAHVDEHTRDITISYLS
jgi:L-threonylcarbamoyladenylate synthase